MQTYTCILRTYVYLTMLISVFMFISCVFEVDGKWSQWGIWSVCDVTCESGHMTRTRTCVNPAPQHGGKDCIGLNQEASDCHLKHCPSISLYHYHCYCNIITINISWCFYIFFVLKSGVFKNYKIFNVYVSSTFSMVAMGTVALWRFMWHRNATTFATMSVRTWRGLSRRCVRYTKVLQLTMRFQR